MGARRRPRALGNARGGGIAAQAPPLPGLARAIIGVTLAAGGSKLLKAAFPKMRPNGQDRESFPSQHAAEVVAAAGSMVGEEPPAEAGAALGAAALTSLSRLPARKHDAIDIVAGIALGGLAALAAHHMVGLAAARVAAEGPAAA